MFTHYLITRFNIRISDYGPEYMNSPEMDLEWLTNRLNLFLKYCAPSVLEQSNKQFTWLIYFDPDTPRIILEQLHFLINSGIKVEFIFIENYPKMLDDIVQKIKSASSRYVITSRLDNDDIISKSFIDDIQLSFEPRHDIIINFTMGYEYSIPDRVLTKWNSRFKNQFISIIEERDAPNVQSIYGFPHWKPPPSSKILNITGKPYWIYLGHQLNHSGLPITGIPLFIKPVDLNLFPLSVRKIHLSFIQTILYAFRWLPQVLSRRLKARK